jgi:hypothetical protein
MISYNYIVLEATHFQVTRPSTCALGHCRRLICSYFRVHVHLVIVGASSVAKVSVILPHRTSFMFESQLAPAPTDAKLIDPSVGAPTPEIYFRENCLLFFGKICCYLSVKLPAVFTSCRAFVLLSSSFSFTLSHFSFFSSFPKERKKFPRFFFQTLLHRILLTNTLWSPES